MEMTSYHIEIQDNFDIFQSIRSEYVRAPYPAWTAVEVAGLRRLGALMELRLVASTQSSAQ
jgi:enamine deaminase RidA (YjgF/YER057c/UK114 family)